MTLSLTFAFFGTALLVLVPLCLPLRPRRPSFSDD